jgi:hypothetical protein
MWHLYQGDITAGNPTEVNYAGECESPAGASPFMIAPQHHPEQWKYHGCGEKDAPVFGPCDKRLKYEQERYNDSQPDHGLAFSALSDHFVEFVKPEDDSH